MLTIERNIPELHVSKNITSILDMFIQRFLRFVTTEKNYGHTYHNVQLAEQMDYIYCHIFEILNGFIAVMFLLFLYC